MSASKKLPSLVGDLISPSRTSHQTFNLPTLLNKNCIITGGTRGIGAAIARRFASEGANVIIVGRNADNLSTAKDKLDKFRSSEDQTLQTFQGDVTKEDSWAELFKNVAPPHILVNCAGITQRSLLSRMSKQDTRAVLDTNLHSAIMGSRFAVRSMIKSKTPGCIINVSSLLATKGTSGTSVYAASKAGLLGLTSSLAVEYGRYKIRVNALVPGYIDTDMTRDLRSLGDEAKRIPLERLGTVDEVADAAVFLATNPYANNCILNLDGGLSAT